MTKDHGGGEHGRRLALKRVFGDRELDQAPGKEAPRIRWPGAMEVTMDGASRKNKKKKKRKKANSLTCPPPYFACEGECRLTAACCDSDPGPNWAAAHPDDPGSR